MTAMTVYSKRNFIAKIDTAKTMTKRLWSFFIQYLPQK